MRSVVVVFPASMCAMIPMFRQRLSGTCRGTILSLSLLPAHFELAVHLVTHNRIRLVLLIPAFTSDSARTPYSPRPCDARLPSSSSQRRDHWPHPAARSS